MTREEIIHDKINYFLRRQCKVHLTKIPTSKFPHGKYHNGLIIQKFNDMILFDDPIQNSLKPVEIFISEIDDMEEYKEKEESDGNKN